MKVAISSTGKNLDSNIDPRFGRCAYFIIAETDNMSFESYANESIALSGGAGIQAVSFVVSNGAEAILTGNCGPKAMTAFTASGVSVFAGQTGTVRDSIERLKAGRLTPSTQPNVAEKAGAPTADKTGAVVSMGIGRCRGGSGRGMGMGGGRGMNTAAGLGNSGGKNTSREDTLSALKKEAQELHRKMAAIKNTIDGIE